MVVEMVIAKNRAAEKSHVFSSKPRELARWTGGDTPQLLSLTLNNLVNISMKSR